MLSFLLAKGDKSKRALVSWALPDEERFRKQNHITSLYA